MIGLNVNQTFFHKEVKDFLNFTVLYFPRVVPEIKDSFYEFVCAILLNKTKYGSLSTIGVYYPLCKISVPD